ncbi:MAG: hypothetical protein Q8M31_01700 [Beijerinckiaceae bacterium]|nr:hypothetical protein [Beijerinckiaceae bacterium]
MLQSADQVTSTLAAWLRSCFASAHVSLTDAPLEEGGEPVIQLTLVDILVESASNRIAPTTVLRLCYFITVSASDILLVHKYLGEIAFALAMGPVLEIPDADPTILSLERRTEGPLGVAVSIPISRIRTKASSPPVLFPPDIKIDQLGLIEGMVEGANGGAVAGAVVEIPSLQLRQVTGPDGRFRFHAQFDASEKLRVTARKHRFSKTVTAKVGQGLTLRLA